MAKQFLWPGLALNPYEPPQADLSTPRRSPLATNSIVFRFCLHLLPAVVVCFGLFCLADYVYVKHDEISDAFAILVWGLAVVVSFTLGMIAAKNSSLNKRLALGLLMIAINFAIQLLLGMSLGLAFHFAIGGSL